MSLRKEKMSINLKGSLFSLDEPLVMGILNVTPDSFYSGSRCQSEQAIMRRAEDIVNEGGAIIDVGAYSSRPQAENIPEEEEMKRLGFALEIIRRKYPDVPVSVDTFRASVAWRCVEEYGVAVINDISGGELDKNMFETGARLQVPYILMHMRGTPRDMMRHTHYENLIAEMLLYFSERVERLTSMGVNDIIIDPGFGFSKTLDDNYLLMNRLEEFTVFGFPLLVGVSRKSMIYKYFGTTPAESLTGTTVLNTLALSKGAGILRVHDVKEAVEAVKLVQKTFSSR